MVTDWLKSGMFLDDPDADTKIEKIVKELTDHSLTLSHARHISAKQAKNDLNLTVSYLEDDDKLQDAVLSIHHACIQTLTDTPAVKIVENQNGVAFIESVGQIIALNPAV